MITKGFFSKDNGFTQLFMAVFVAFMSLFLFYSLQIALLWIACQPASMEAFNALLTADVNLLKLSQAVQAMSLFVIPAFISAFLLTKTTVSDYLCLKKNTNLPLYLLVSVSALLALPLVNWLAEWNNAFVFPPFLEDFEVWARGLEESAAAATENFLSVSSLPDLLLNILIVGVLAAVGEELMFRGVLQKIFSRWTGKETLAIWLTAFVFSAVHFQFFGFLPRLLLGAYFGYLLVWTRTIWLPILAHFLHNSIAVIAFYLHHNGYIPDNPDELGSQDTLWLTVVCAALFAGTVYLLKRQRQDL
jgi:membrane protease YdiL (CAAX protease family)